MSQAPVITGIAYSQGTYNPGDPIEVKVTGQAGSQIQVRQVTGTATLTDQATGLEATLAGLFTLTTPVEDTTTAGFTDGDGRQYDLVSVSQTPGGQVTAVFRSVA